MCDVIFICVVHFLYDVYLYRDLTRACVNYLSDYARHIHDECYLTEHSNKVFFGIILTHPSNNIC